MSTTFRDFVTGGELTVFPSEAGAPDINEFMKAAGLDRPEAAGPENKAPAPKM